jgi:predicted MFS family arabinose efflux permease
MATVALGLGLLVAAGAVGPWTLLAFTFVLGAGAAVSGPAWQSVVPHLVPKPDLPAAIALNSAGFNLARAAGPAIAGVLIGWAGIAAPFIVNALSFAAVIAAFWWWRRPAASPGRRPPERLTAAIGAGLRFARDSRPLRATLIRAVAFFSFGAAYWALLPLILRVRLAAGPEAFGLVLASIGGGAVLGAVLLARLRRHLDADRVVAVGTLGTAACLVVFAYAPALWAVAVAGVVAGANWILVVPTLNTEAQLSVPDPMRGRGLALLQMAMFGGIGVGSIVWGVVAERVGVTPALVLAAVGALVAMVATRRWRLQAAGS